MALEAKIIKNPYTGEEKSTIQWASELNITDNTFSLRMRESMKEHGELIQSVFSKNKPCKLNNNITSRTKSLKSTGLQTVSINTDTRRKYKRMEHWEKKTLFKPLSENPKPDLVALGLAVAPVAGQYTTK